MVSTEKVIVRLPPDTIRLLQELVDRGEFPNLSEAVRSAVDQFIDGHFSPDSIIEILEEPSDDGIIEMSALVHGDASVMGVAVQDAVREYIRARIDRG